MDFQVSRPFFGSGVISPDHSLIFSPVESIWHLARAWSLVPKPTCSGELVCGACWSSSVPGYTRQHAEP